MTDSQKLDMLLEMVTGIKKEQNVVQNTVTDINKRLINVEQEQKEMKQEQKAIVSELGRIGKKLDSIEDRVTGLEELKPQVSENTKILKSIEDKTSTYKAEHDQMSNKLDHIQGDITSLKKDSEKGEEAYNIVQTLKNAFSK